MEIVNLLVFKERSELRQWLAKNHQTEKQCWVVSYRSENTNRFYKKNVWVKAH